MDTPEEVIPNYPILKGTRPLMPDEVSFVYGVHSQDELLQFTLNKQIAVEEVFGLGPYQDEDVTAFAYYDLKQGMVRDTLDVKVLEEDGGKQYYGYRLRPEELALLLTAMAPYCREKTGMSLEMLADKYREEHSASAVPVEDTKTAGTRQYFTSPDYRIRPKENSKYGITDIAHPDDKELHRIVALRNIGTEVKAGDLGGYVQSQGNLSYQNGDDAWIYDDAIVKGFAFVADNSQIRNHAEISGFANIGGAALICGHAVATDNALVHGALMRDYAVVSGHSFVGVSKETNLAPALLGNCEVRGSVHGFVRVSGRVAIADQEKINNDTEEPLELNNQNHLQKGPGSYFCGRRKRGKGRNNAVK